MADLTWMSPGDWMALLVESSVRTAIILAVAWGSCRLLRRRSAAVRHWAWTLSMVAVAVAPLSLEFAPKLRIPDGWIPAWQSDAVREMRNSTAIPSEDSVAFPAEPPVDPSRSADEVRSRNMRAPLPAESAPAETKKRADESAKLASPVPSRVQEADVPAPTRNTDGGMALAAPTLGVIWAAGFILFFTRFITGHLRLRSMARGASVVESDAIIASSFAGDWKIRPAVRFLQSRTETMPMTWGWRKPVVLLPAGFSKWDEERRAMTIYHELAHVRRADWLTQTSAQIVRAVYWFHPLVWLGVRRMRVEADRACDDMVLSAGVKASGYAGHLVRAAREFRTAGLRPWVAIAMAHPSSLNERVEYVLDGKVERSGLRRGAQLALALGVAMVVLLIPTVDAVGQTAAPAIARGEVGRAPRTERREAGPNSGSALVSRRARLIREESAREEIAREDSRRHLLLAQAPAPDPEPQVSEDVYVEEEVIREAEREVEREVRKSFSNDFHFENKFERREPRLSGESLRIASNALLKALQSSDVNVRAEAAEALGNLGSNEGNILEALSAALSDPEPRVQRNAVEALGRLLQNDEDQTGERVMRLLRPALDSSDPQLRREVAEALGRLPGTAAVGPLIQLASDSDPKVLREAIESLGHSLERTDSDTARSALPVLEKALSHEDAAIRREVVETLGRLGMIANEVVPLLAKAAEDPDPKVQREAVESLGRISSGGFDWTDDHELIEEGKRSRIPVFVRERIKGKIDRTIQGTVAGAVDGAVDGVIEGVTEGVVAQWHKGR